jgi:D-glucuronyl C5-epimerase C-terminus
MPWGTALMPPWYSGYCNAAVIGTLAVTHGLAPNAELFQCALNALGYLNLPIEYRGAKYSVDGFDFIAEYPCQTPPVPNYRVLDGELSAIPYLYNAAVIFKDIRFLSTALRLVAGIQVSLRLFRAEGGAPLFALDGQPMTPGYMWQLWMNLQLLDAIFKDRQFTRYAREWRAFMPANFAEEGYPL